MNDSDEIHAYQGLGPDTILAAVESIGLLCDGRVSALNSYENRVYQVGLEGRAPVIAKFYRPRRWSDESILEEHAFTDILDEREIPVIAPLKNEHGDSLFYFENFRFALYPRVGGREPELDDPEHLMQIGRCLGRIHNVSAIESFNHRPVLDVDTYAIHPREYLLANNFIPGDILPAYTSITEHLIQDLQTMRLQAGNVSHIRLHGDFHLGNILWFDNAPFIVDFDDARTGPAIQDLWMLLSGDRPFMTARLYDLLEGYCEFRDFDPRELQLIEALRTMRIMHYSGWLARRWDDPAFPAAFPWFNTQRYWEDHVLSLREQSALLQEPPLEWQRP